MEEDFLALQPEAMLRMRSYRQARRHDRGDRRRGYLNLALSGEEDPAPTHHIDERVGDALERRFAHEKPLTVEHIALTAGRDVRPSRRRQT
jgi:hypothetical protein